MAINIEKKMLKLRKMSFRRNIVVIGLFILFALPSFMFVNMMSSNSNESVPKNVQSTKNYSGNNVLFNYQTLTSGPTIGTPHLSRSQPNPTQSDIVTSNISDANGIKNATLSWNYTTLSGSPGSSASMSPTPIPVFTSNAPNPWNLTSYIDDTYGNFTTTTTHHLYSEYTFAPTSNKLYDRFSMTVSRNQSSTNNPNNLIVFWQLYGKNVSSNQWVLYNSVGSNTSTSNIANSVNIVTTNSSTSYKVIVVMYDSTLNTIRIPTASGITASVNQYQATIPQSVSSSRVTYRITAFNNLNQKTQSPNYYYVSDYAPTLSFYQMASTVLKVSNFDLKVTVYDQDNVTNINNNSVKAKYYTDNPLQYTIVPLTFENTTGNYTSIFSAQIDLSHITSLSNSITFSVNASDNFNVNGTLTKMFTLDVSGPSMISYYFNTSLDHNPPPYYYVYNVSTIPELHATMSDPSGIHDVTLYYKYNSGSYQSIAMTNTTFNNETMTTMVFNATLPTSTTSATVNWYLVSHDFGNNANTTPVLTFYFDGNAPVLVQQMLYPPYVSNTTAPYLLFNVTDVDGAYTPIFYYSYNYKLSWTQATVSPINYNNPAYTRNSTTYTYKYLPAQIPDDQIANISQRIVFPYTVDQAILTLGVTFTEGSYLRIWIENDLGTKALVFDRVSGAISTTYQIDLTKLGFTTRDFVNSTFFLITESDSLVYYGQIDQFSIRLRDYTIPLGYQYIVSLPASNNDTYGYYFFDLKDYLNYEVNTTIFTYYIDGTMPSVNVTDPTAIQTSSLDLHKASYVNVTLNLFDKGGIFLVEVYYMINNATSYDWIILSTHLNITSGSLTVEIPISSVNGTMYFKVRVYDHVGFSASTPVYMIDYINGSLSESTSKSGSNIVSDLLIPLLLLGGVVVVGGGVLYFGGSKLKKSGKLTAVKNKISSKKPPQ